MIFGGILLVLTFLIDSYHEPDDGFNYAYVSGIAMIAVFFASFYLFFRGSGYLNR